MRKERVRLYRKLEKMRDSKVLVYVTGDRPGLETQIHSDVLDYFVDHLDLMKKSGRLSLFLYTRGGSTLAAWSLVNLLRQFCDEFEVIVPSKAHSSGTLICLGANSIIMTKQATLGPIDPSVNTPLNPGIPGGGPEARMPVSVEAIRGYIDLAQTELGINGEQELSNILVQLSSQIHPMVLGNVFRARSQIKMLAQKLLKKQLSDKDQIERIISFLSSESGSHDYTIDRVEAREDLGLNIVTPDEELYKVIKSIMDDIKADLELNNRFDANGYLGAQQSKGYAFRRGLIESIVGGTDYFLSEGTAERVQSVPNFPGMNPAQVVPTHVEMRMQFEGWKHE